MFPAHHLEFRLQDLQQLKLKLEIINIIPKLWKTFIKIFSLVYVVKNLRYLKKSFLRCKKFKISKKYRSYVVKNSRYLKNHLSVVNSLKIFLFKIYIACAQYIFFFTIFYFHVMMALDGAGELIKRKKKFLLFQKK